MDKAERLYPTGRHKTLALSNKKKPSFWVGCSSPLISLSLSRLLVSVCLRVRLSLSFFFHSSLFFFFFFFFFDYSPPLSPSPFRFLPPLSLSGAFRLRFCWKTRQGGKRQQKEDEERTERERETAGKKKTTHRIACFVFACFPFVCFLPSFLPCSLLYPSSALVASRRGLSEERRETPRKGVGEGSGGGVGQGGTRVKVRGNKSKDEREREKDREARAHAHARSKRGGGGEKQRRTTNVKRSPWFEMPSRSIFFSPPLPLSYSPLPARPASLF